VEPASVGIILDSSIIIAAERSGHTVREILEQVKVAQGKIEIGVSVVTVAELVASGLGQFVQRNECLALPTTKK
jgi:predicted nucleic acid-binding protein